MMMHGIANFKNKENYRTAYLTINFILFRPYIISN